MNRRRHGLRLLLMAPILLPACGYRIEGRAVPGGFGTLTWVDAGDPRLQQQGVSGVRVQLVRDPDRMRREVVAETTTAADGSFTLETKTFGAGWMDERWELTASRSGYGAAVTRAELPVDPSSRRLLVEMQRGGSSQGTASEGSGSLFDEAARWDPSIQRKPASP